MEDVYLVLNSVKTHLLLWGNPLNCNGKDIIVCITGNPGVPDFYTEFGSSLHINTGLPVCVIGQSGHEDLSTDEDKDILSNHKHLFNLEGQLKHKLDLIDHLDKQSKLHLIGHSVGAWMILEIINRDKLLSDRVNSVNLLFPTLQRMSESRNGLLLNNVLRRINLFVVMLFTLVYLLPEAVKDFLIGLYLQFNSLPQHYKGRIKKYLNPKVGEKVLYLGYDEMDNIRVLNEDVLNNIKSKTNIIYSNNDGWVPVSYIKDLQKYEPHMKLKQVKVDHSFVLKSSEEVADMVADYIKTKF